MMSLKVSLSHSKEKEKMLWKQAAQELKLEDISVA